MKMKELLVTTDNLEIQTNELGLNTYKSSETRFKHLPLFGGMSPFFIFNGIFKGLILIEYNYYTGEIINSAIIHKNN